MIRLPGAAGGGRRVEQDVSLIDVFPTLLGLLGFALPTPVDGIDLTPSLRRDEAPPERILFAEFGGTKRRWAKAAWDARHRLVVFSKGQRYRQELYDRASDRAETRDLAATEAEKAGRLAATLDARFPPDHRIRPGDAAPPVAPIPEDVRARLRALGYEE